jgi:hypothetical protein
MLCSPFRYLLPLTSFAPKLSPSPTPTPTLFFLPPCLLVKLAPIPYYSLLWPRLQSELTFVHFTCTPT